MDVDVVFTYYSLEDFNILSITDLLDQFPCPKLYFSPENRVTVFGDPDKVSGEAKDCMASISIISHIPGSIAENG